MNWIDFRTTYPLDSPRKNFRDIPSDVIFNISNDNNIVLKREALKISTSPYNKDEQESFIQSSKLLLNYLNPSLLTSINQEIENGAGYAIITGLPIDTNLPATPQSGGNLASGYKETHISESMLIMLGGIIKCEAFNFRQEGFGTSPLIDNIVPLKGKRTQKGAGGFDNKFPFHCESAWHRKRPDYLILVGIREDEDARTLVFSSNNLKDFKLLALNQKYKNSFRLKAPQLYTQMEKEGVPLGTPTFAYLPPIQDRNTNDQRTLNINFNGMESTELEALEWLKQTEDFIENNSVSLVLRPGTAIILNNDLTCHTRTNFSPEFCGKDRWFLRAYFKKDLWNLENDIKRLNEEELATMRNLGWLDDRGKLSSKFFTFLKENYNQNSFDNEMVQIINKAYYLTPFESSRIV
jgi:hypothetical protein